MAKLLFENGLSKEEILKKNRNKAIKLLALKCLILLYPPLM